MSKKSSYSNGFLLSHIELTPRQQEFFKIISNKKTRIVFLSGPAGSAKSFLAVYSALHQHNEDNDIKISYLRSVVESADRSLGFLKGDMDDKFGPYMAPLLDKIDELLNEPEKIMLNQRKVLEAQPINFTRGQSWRDKFVIIDESQNLSLKELTTLITRIGRNTKIVFCGDVMQSDIRSDAFQCFCELFNDEESSNFGIHNLKFGKEDIIRDPILSYVIEKIEKMKK